MPPQAKSNNAPPPEFGKLLNRAIGSSERPVPVPPGTWTLLCKSFKFDKSAQKKTPYVEFTWGLMSPHEDVELPEGYSFQNKTAKDKFYITDDAMYRLEDVQAMCGLEGSVADNIPNMVNKTIIGHFSTSVGTARTPGGEPPIFSNIDQYAAVED